MHPADAPIVKQGLLTSRDSLKLFDEFLPDPNHQARYDQMAKWIEQYREDYAVFARIRLGTASMFESMGLDVFSLMMFDDPDLVKEIHRRFSEWSARVVENLNKLDIDFIWANDDHADTKAPWVNMEMVRGVHPALPDDGDRSKSRSRGYFTATATCFRSWTA